MPKNQGELRVTSLLDEPYKGILVWSAGGIKITIESEMSQEEGSQEEVDRRAARIMEHFQILINSK